MKLAFSLSLLLACVEARDVLLVGLYDSTNFTGDSANYSEYSVYTYSLEDRHAAPRFMYKSKVGLSPSWFVQSPRPGSHTLFAVSEASSYMGQSNGSVASLELDCHGFLSVTGREASGGAAPVFLSTSPVEGDGFRVVAANYGAGSVSVLRVAQQQGADRIGTVEATSEFGTGAMAHSAAFAPGHSGAFFVPTLGLDEVQQLKLEERHGGVALLANGKPLKVSAGQGPRHIKFHGNIGVLANEGQTANITCTVVLVAYDAASGRIRELQSAQTLPAGMSTEDMYPAEVLFTADGRHVLVSNRDHTSKGRDGVTVFRVSGQPARLSFQSYTPVGHYPRSMVLTQDGLLVVGNQLGKTLSLFKVDFETGALERALPHDVPVNDEAGSSPQSPAFVGVFSAPPCDVVV